MKLLLDFGNTRCKWALLKNEELSELNSEAYKDGSAILSLDHLLNLLPLNQVEGVHVVSVLSDEFNASLKKKINEQTGLALAFYFSHKEKYDVSLSYSNPLDYGADRYASLVAVHHAFSKTKIIVDYGTAVAIDAIDQDGKHLGGLILPGEELMRSSLIGNTERVFCNKEYDDVQHLNSNTSDAVYAGSALGLRHGIWGIVGEIRQTLGEHKVILTGGNAFQLQHELIEPYTHNPTLVLDGLKTMIDFNH
ncbi:MAG: type III pantothenate kinase [Pseudomonadota bacterium]